MFNNFDMQDQLLDQDDWLSAQVNHLSGNQVTVGHGVTENWKGMSKGSIQLSDSRRTMNKGQSRVTNSQRTVNKGRSSLCYSRSNRYDIECSKFTYVMRHLYIIITLSI